MIVRKRKTLFTSLVIISTIIELSSSILVYLVLTSSNLQKNPNASNLTRGLSTECDGVTCGPVKENLDDVTRTTIISFGTVSIIFSVCVAVLNIFTLIMKSKKVYYCATILYIVLGPYFLIILLLYYYANIIPLQDTESDGLIMGFVGSFMYTFGSIIQIIGGMLIGEDRIKK